MTGRSLLCWLRPRAMTFLEHLRFYLTITLDIILRREP